MGSGAPRSFAYGPLIASLFPRNTHHRAPPTKTRASTQPPLTPKNDTCASYPQAKPSCHLPQSHEKCPLRGFSGGYIGFSFFLTPY